MTATRMGDDLQFYLSLLLLLALAAGILIPVWRRQAERAAKERCDAQAQAVDPRSRPPPNPDGKFTAFELWPQARYRVIAPFVDFDNVTHEIGERWTFLNKAFLPYEDGLSLFVERNGEQQHIRLQCRDDAQAHIVHAFSDFVVEE
jgi:hypothetical protein